MRKLSFKVMTCLLAGSLMASSCVGSFSLFNQYAAWQKDMTDNKFVNAIVGFILMPFAIPITIAVDAIVLNTIEFWTGDNPVASNVGRTQQVMGQDGRYYAVKTLRNGYEVKAPTGEVTLFTYDKDSRTWSMSQDGVTKELFRFNEDGQSISATINGETRDFTLNEQGVYEARMAAGQGQFFAAR